jgi:hypothetical protein
VGYPIGNIQSSNRNFYFGDQNGSLLKKGKLGRQASNYYTLIGHGLAISLGQKWQRAQVGKK